MARPDKKLSVTPETRRKWLQRHDDDGETPQEIARREFYDVRTVRKQLDLARQEKETKETRLIVLRDAAQAHYADLCKRAEEMETSLSDKGSGKIGLEDRMGAALRQHLPRSPLWKYIDQWNKLQQDLQTARVELRNKYENELVNNQELKSAFDGGTPDITALVDFFSKQTDFWSQGGNGVDIAHAFRTEPSEEGFVNLRLGGYKIGTVNENRAGAVNTALLSVRKTLPDLAEYQALTHIFQGLDNLAPNIREELAIITLKRVISGRCKYCPI